MLEKRGPVEVLIIHDTGFLKKGSCQIAASLSMAKRHAGQPIAYRAYLPKYWTQDEERGRRAGLPEEVAFQTKREIAMERITKAYEDGVPPGGDADGCRLRRQDCTARWYRVIGIALNPCY